MKPPSELLEFYLEDSEESRRWALTHRDNHNPVAALENWTSAASTRFLRGLVGWRTGLLDPIPDLRAVLELSEAAIEFVETTEVGALRQLFDPVPGAYSALLLDRAESPVVAETSRLAVQPVPRALTIDRTLEGWLVGSLVGRDPGAGPDVAAGLKSRKRMALVSETYTTYFVLVALTPDDVVVARDLTRRAIESLARRRRDPYYAGGIEYEGGGAYNDLVVDYHLAALWHVRGWDSAALTPEERVHLQLPSGG